MRDQSGWDLSTERTMMGRPKLLGGELHSSGLKKDKAEKRSGEMSDTKALKEALKLAKHKGDQRDQNLSFQTLGCDFRYEANRSQSAGLCGIKGSGRV